MFIYMYFILNTGGIVYTPQGLENKNLTVKNENSNYGNNNNNYY